MVNNSEDRLEVMKREIDALQIAVTSSTKPWYKNVSLLVSIIALLFSFGTTYVSYKRTAYQDVQNARQELRGLLQRLSALPKENVENSKKYASDPAAMTTIGGFINQENTLLAIQAAEIAKKLPAGAVSSAEYYAIAIALQNSYNLAGAAKFLDLATESENDFNTEISALRMKANLQFIQGHPESGRVEYQKALGIFSKYGGYDDFTRLSTNVWTELAWANSEASLFGPNAEAKQHINNAKKMLSSAAPGPGVQNLKTQVAQAESVFESFSSSASSTGQTQFNILPSITQGSIPVQQGTPTDPAASAPPPGR